MDDERQWRKRNAWVFCSCVLGLFAVGLWLLWPELQEGYERFEPWKVVATSTFDLLACFWCLRLIVHGPIVDEEEERKEDLLGAQRQFVWLAGSLLLGMATDAAFTLYAIHQEKQGLAESVRARGTIDRAVPWGIGRPPAYSLRCSFIDEAGDWHNFTTRVFLNGIGPEDAAAIRGGLLPHPVEVQYDQRWPRRAWLVGANVDWPYSEVYRLSLVILGFQFILLLVMLGHLLPTPESGDRLPWWHQYYPGLPLFIESGILVFFGLFSRVHGAG